MEDFVHEGRSEGDDHCVTPRLAKGPHYDHPDCPSKISMFDFDFLKIVCHLLQSMSLISGKTFPWSCFSLTAGSNVRFSRISCLSWDIQSFQTFTTPITSILTITFLETLGCCSGRSVARANQRKHLIPKITNQNNRSIKKWFRIPSQREERN